MSKKTRTIESFSKDAIVAYLKHKGIVIDYFRLTMIESDIEWKKLEALINKNMEEQSKALKANKMRRYYTLQASYELLSKRRERLLKKLDDIEI